MSMLVWSLTEWFFFFLIIYSCDRKLQFSFTISWGCSHIFCTFMNYLALFMEPVFSSFVLLIILHKQSHTNIEKSNLASYSIKCLNKWTMCQADRRQKAESIVASSERNLLVTRPADINVLLEQTGPDHFLSLSISI